MKFSAACLAALMQATLVATGGCAHKPPQPVVSESAVDLTATVEDVDPATRMVSLRTADGRYATVHAGPEIRNFDQIEAGDTVTVTYYEALVAEVTTPELAAAGVQRGEAIAQAARGARPAGGVAEMTTATVAIESVDRSHNTVTFTRADGLRRSLAVDDPDAQAFIRKLKKGDLVQVTYMEAVAVSVRPVTSAGQ